MKNKYLFLLLFSLVFFQNYAQNQPSLQKQKLEEFREIFIHNNEIKTGSLSNYKIITYGIDECTIKIETIDYENSNNENVTVTFTTSGAMLKKNGELHYKTKAIKEIIENKITKLITITSYKNSKDIGLLLKLKNKEQYKKTKEIVKELSRYCKLEKKNKMKKLINCLFLLAFLSSCAPKAEIIKYGQHYKKHKDYKSLSKAVELMPETITTAQVKKILGKPIDNGFDYRYLVDSTGVNNCTIGAVFTIDLQGKINHRWVDEICE